MNIKKFTLFSAFFFVCLGFSFCWNTPSSTATNDFFELDFSKETGNWKDIVGTSHIENKDDQLIIKNVTADKNIESVTLATDSPLQNTGEIELTFLYEGQKNFGLVFRSDATKNSQWQSFAYNGNGSWQLGQPGGNWITDIKSTPLIAGTTYRLLVRYSGKSIEAFLNGQSFYQNEQVTYPNNGSSISDEWVGNVGIRLFGDRVTLRVLSLRNGALNSIPLEPSPPENAESLVIIRSKWKENLVGNFEKTPELANDTDVQKYIQQLSNQATTLYDSLDKSANRTELWVKKASDTKSANLTTQFKNIATLAKSYGTKGTSFYQKDEVLAQIVSALDFMTKDGLYSGKKYFGNWWDWQVGVPQEFLTTLFILYDDIPVEKTTNYAKIMANYLPNAYQQLYGKSQDSLVDLSFIPNFVTTGANRTDLAFSVLGINTLQANSQGIASAVTSVEDVFKLVNSGDGFYLDGSFIQHNDIPYTGSYGNVLIKGVGKIFSVVSETEWEAPETTIKEFVQNVDKAFIPLLVNGEMMPMVNGRSISRAPAATKEGFGSATLYNLLIVSEFADSQSQLQLKEATNYWMQKNTSYYLNNARDFKDLLLVKNLLTDSTISSDKKPFIGSHLYSAMDRFVYSNEQINLGLSMYSNRISSFEAGNKENKHGWHTSDGMLSLFNSDQQFNAAYWPTIDPYRLPGTTVDTIPLKDEIGAFTTIKSKESHVGGVTDNTNAVLSMHLNKAGTKNNGVLLPMNLQAKKSWFVFDGKIIALGAGINGTTKASIETVIDNRMLDASSSYQLLNQNNERVENSQGTLTKGDWFLLQSNQANQSLGYVLLDDQKIKTTLETRQGTYQQINDAFPSANIYEESYQQILVEHGANATNARYAYLLYPNATKETLTQWTTTSPIEVLANTDSIQAVYDKQLDLIGATVWATTGGEVKGYHTDKPADFLVQKEGKKVSIHLSNPKQTNEKITFTLPSKITEMLTNSEKVQLSSDKKSLIVDTTGALGQGFTIEATVE